MWWDDDRTEWDEVELKEAGGMSRGRSSSKEEKRKRPKLQAFNEITR